MSEQQSLISSGHDSDVEGGTENSEKSRLTRWRERTGEFLETDGFHKAVITLISIDAACVLADLGYSFLSPGCTPPEGPDAPFWLDVLSHISLAITTFFLIEIPLALWSFGFQYYNPFSRVPHATLHLFDAIIILTTFVLEVVLKGRERELAGLLIILRLWRLVKLAGGIVVGAGEIEEDSVKRLAEVQNKLNEALSSLSEAREENQKLRARITSMTGTSDSE